MVSSKADLKVNQFGKNKSGSGQHSIIMMMRMKLISDNNEAEQNWGLGALEKIVANRAVGW